MKQYGIFGLAVAIVLLAISPAQAVPQNDVVGYWTLNLKPGFNLVAFPVLPDTPTLQEVIGDRLGLVEVTTWDDALHGWRWAKYDPQTRVWTGNLYLLARGTAFWINLRDAQQPKSLMALGRPELYTRFNWNRLNYGRQFYAPTYGKEQALAEIPPVEPRDRVIAWDSNRRQFQIAEANGSSWRSPNFEQIEPDRAYIADLHHRAPRQVGPPLPIEAQYQAAHPNPNFNERDDAPGIGDCQLPPRPLVVGNSEGLPVCNPNGEACNGELAIKVIRERLEPDAQGNRLPVAEQVTQYRVTPDPARAGSFRVALTLGEGDGTLQPGDRVYLVAKDSNGAETRSTSFEVTNDEDVTDLSFNEPLSAGGITAEVPATFSLGSPHPNPFNDRFSVEVRLPETVPVDVTLFDVMGRVAFRQVTPLSAGTHRLTLQAGGMSAGVYLVKVTAGKDQALAKVAHLK